MLTFQLHAALNRERVRVEYLDGVLSLPQGEEVELAASVAEPTANLVVEVGSMLIYFPLHQTESSLSGQKITFP